MTPHHVVVPYPATNSSVRTRALHWIDRLVGAGRVDGDDVVVHGPGHAQSSVPSAANLLLVRNAKRLTRGRNEAGLLQRASLGVYDIDDGLPWDDGSLPDLGRWWKRPFPRSLLATRCAASADRVIAGNEILADWALQHCADVRVVPTCVEPDDYRVRTDWQIADGGPVIGWIGSSATEHFLIDIAEPLQEVHRRTGARLSMISGGGPVAPELAEFTTKRRWDSNSTRSIADWDIGVMPLRDGAYERAKCGYKLLQYAASGVPAVGSPVGINERLLHDMDGIAPTSTDHWVDALLQVLDESASQRAERAAAGLVVAEAYSYATWETQWLDAVGW